MNRNFLERLVCPLCKTSLSYDGSLNCKKCSRRYDFIGGIPNFLPNELLTMYNKELKEQDLHEEKSFYENLYGNLSSLDDGHCVDYGYDKLYEFMQEIPKGSLLDVGCGVGHHSSDLSMIGYEVTGIDISIRGLSHAVRIKETYSQNSEFVLGDAENLPFADRSYDVVFCGLILHHFPNSKLLLKELSRVCKSFFVAFEVNSYDPLSFLRFNVLNPMIGVDNISRNQRSVSPFKLQKKLELLGFERFEFGFIDIHHYIGRHPGSVESRMLNIYKGISRILPYRYRFNKFMVKCKKACI